MAGSHPAMTDKRMIQGKPIMLQRPANSLIWLLANVSFATREFARRFQRFEERIRLDSAIRMTPRRTGGIVI
jgi:hypothetical protein